VDNGAVIPCLGRCPPSDEVSLSLTQGEQAENGSEVALNGQRTGPDGELGHDF
jgi:hypothetical protein